MAALPWDGSELGQVARNASFARSKDSYGKVWKFSVDGREVEGYVFRAGGIFPALIDELKPLFGLEKTGCHLFQHKGNKYVLYRRRALAPLPRPGEAADEDLFLDARAVYAVRRALGVKPEYRTVALLDRETGRVVTMQSNASGTNKTSSSITKLYFREERACDVFLAALDVPPREVLPRLRAEVQALIKRLGRSEVWIEQYLLGNVMDALPL